METIIERNVVYGTPDVNTASASASAVSWGAIIAGAVAASALSLILFILGVGLGLTSVSPWSQEGLSAEAFGISAILWITFTSLVAAALGGYITGRLRTRWLAVQTDEVYFRDTAHGFLAWGVATLLTATLFTTTTAALITGGVKAGAAVAGGVADTAVTAASTGAAAGVMTEDENGLLSYFTDSLFRRAPGSTLPARAISPPLQTPAPAQPANAPGITQEEQAQAADVAATDPTADLDPEQQAALSAGGASPETMVVPQTPSAATQYRQPVTETSLAEVTRIFTRAIQKDNLSQEDLSYVAALVSQHTGLSVQEAETRVNETFTNFQTELREMEAMARTVADEARAASAKVALWLFIALLAGAFVGSLSATYGGRQRDL